MTRLLNKVVLEARKGTAFKVLEDGKGNVKIEVVNLDTAHYYPEIYAHPPIPIGYRYYEGSWTDGFIIERDWDDSQFVWIPVGFLSSEATLDGIHFDGKFGRRACTKDSFCKNAYEDPLDETLIEQIESVSKYGGFYISRYNISRDSSGNPISKSRNVSWTSISWNEAKRVAEGFENNTDMVKSHLTYGAEYDSVLAFFNRFSDVPKDVSLKTFGLLPEWTQETFKGKMRVVRGVDEFDVQYKKAMWPKNHTPSIGFRIALWIK